MRLVTIVIRGCLIKVTPEQAREFERLERESIRKDWAANQLP
jgi:hypothetical protein